MSGRGARGARDPRPATGALLGTVAPVDLEAATAAARRSRCGRSCRLRARARYVRRAAVAMLDELDDLARAARRRDRLAARAPRALGAAARGPRPARAGRRRPARARRPPALAARGAARPAPHAGCAVARRRRSACAGRRPRRGTSRRSRRPPRCWPATACILAAGAPLAAQRLRAVFLRAGMPGGAAQSCPPVGRRPGASRSCRTCRLCRRVADLPPPTRSARCSCSTARRRPRGRKRRCGPRSPARRAPSRRRPGGSSSSRAPRRGSRRR